MTLASRFGAVVLLGALAAGAYPEQDPLLAKRRAMVAEQIARRDVVGRRVLEAMHAVPRERFVPAEWRHAAYDDSPLPIGDGQTISQPYVVAKMTELLALRPDDVVFELGTGSGYQAAVAARLAAQVYSMEIHPSLAEGARRTLASLEYANVTIRVGDGYFGWAEKGPFDAIVVTAAATEIPPALVAQLKNGGRMVVPVGPAFATQRLMLVEKTPDGQLSTRSLFPVRFVPVLREPR